MPIAKSQGGDFTPLPAGSHIARCFACLSLGTQESPMYPASFKIMLMWETPGETIMQDGKEVPATIQKEYSLTLSEKSKLRADLQSWRGREFTQRELEGFEVSTVVGHPCMLSVVHKTSAKHKVYAAIAGIGGLPKGVVCPPAWHKPVKYEIEEGRSATFASLPQWIRTKIEACQEWQNPVAASSEPEHENEPDLDTEEDSSNIPF